MIVTEQKDIEDIISSIDGDKVFIVGCGECAKVAHTGGEKEVKKMREDLEKNGKEITGISVPQAPCFEIQVGRLLRENKEKILSADVILVMACGLAVQNFNQSLENKSVVPGCNTLFIGAVSKSGDGFSQYCSACGDCVLDTNAAYCPVTRCPKGMLNGPCGGVYDGKCEVDRKKDCVWILIYDVFSKQKNIEDLKNIKAPRDYSKNIKPGYHSLI